MCLVRTCFKEIIVVFEEKPLIFLTKEIDEKIDATLAKYKVTANLLAQLILSQLSSTTKPSSLTEVNGSASLFYIAVCIHGAESLQFFWIQSQTETPQLSLEDHLYEENKTSSSCQHYYTLYHIFLLQVRTRSIVSHNHNFLQYRGTVKVADILLVLSLFYCFPLSAEPSINVSFY